MEKKYRWDIAICLLVPFIFSSVIVYLFFLDNTVMYWIRELVILVACFFECITLYEYDNSRSKDKGLVSGLVISVSISLFNIAGYTISIGKVTSNIPRACCLGIGSILVLVGVILRYVAKKQLQSNFTQSVQILDGHRLIRDGIYSKVRHPAYIGTFFIVLGAVFIYGNIVMFVLLLLILPLGIKRINYEEALLLKKFGKEYTEYKQQVNRFIPKINI